MSTPAAFDSRLGVGTLTIGGTEYAYQASAVRLSPDVSSDDGTPTLAIPAAAAGVDRSPGSSTSTRSRTSRTRPASSTTSWTTRSRVVPFVWTPLTEAGVVYSGDVQLVPMEVGGDVAVQVVTSVELPVVGEPTRTDGLRHDDARARGEKAAE